MKTSAKQQEQRSPKRQKSLDKTLMWAVEKGRLEDAARLIDRGANVNVGYNRYKSPIMTAIARGRQDIVQLLLDKGARFDRRRGDGVMLLVAVQKGHWDVARLMARQWLDAQKNVADESRRLFLEMLERDELIEPGITCSEWRELFPLFSSRPIPPEVWRDWPYQRWDEHTETCLECMDWADAQRLSETGCDLSLFPCVHVATHTISVCCGHEDGWDCCDTVLVKHGNAYGFPLRHKHPEFIKIFFCPWCGERASEGAPELSDDQMLDVVKQRGADPQKFPCAHTAYHGTTSGEPATNPWDDPETQIVSVQRHYGIPIKQSYGEYIPIKFCPWCGTEVRGNEGEEDAEEEGTVESTE